LNVPVDNNMEGQCTHIAKTLPGITFRRLRSQRAANS
jgi:hypothetical protein